MKITITPVTGAITGAVVLGIIGYFIHPDLTFITVVIGAAAGALIANTINKPAKKKKIHRAVHR